MQIPIFRVGGHDEKLNIYSVIKILTKIKIFSNRTLKKTKYFIFLPASHVTTNRHQRTLDLEKRVAKYKQLFLLKIVYSLF